MKKLHAIGWDDQAFSSQSYNRLSSHFEKNFKIRLDVFADSQEFKEAFLNKPSWDFVLLDILEESASGHAKPTGQDLANFVRMYGKNRNTPIFFVSKSPEALFQLTTANISLPVFHISKTDNEKAFAFYVYLTLKATGKYGLKVFIGHGRQNYWEELGSYLEGYKIEYEEFNRQPVAGLTIPERLSGMKDEAGLALIIMSAEDVMKDGKIQARPNVVHEIGFFQAALGIERTIVLKEKSCEKFSNLDGIVYISFDDNNIASCFQKINEILVRENFIL